MENATILATRTAAHLAIATPQCGDWVIFKDGTERRISHVWVSYLDEECKVLAPVETWDIQTSNPNNSYYLGDNGYISYSGGLYTSFSAAHLELTDEQRPARIWFFDRDYARAGGGVYFETPFKVWRASCSAPEY